MIEHLHTLFWLKRTTFDIFVLERFHVRSVNHTFKKQLLDMLLNISWSWYISDLKIYGYLSFSAYEKKNMLLYLCEKIVLIL